MSLMRAKEYLKKYCMEERILEFDVSSATVKDAAIAVGCREEEIAKTLSFIVDGRSVLIVAAGDCKIDNSKYKAEFSAKAKMIVIENPQIVWGFKKGLPVSKK